MEPIPAPALELSPPPVSAAESADPASDRLALVVVELLDDELRELEESLLLLPPPPLLPRMPPRPPIIEDAE